jgi:glyoxylase-like metal-dependent hydrolase (beta-lactamase superfamily II)
MERLRLGNTVFEGNNTVYLFDGDATVLVDTGLGNPEARAELEGELAEHGVTFADIDEVFLTHYHGDHAGLAGAIHEAGRATIRVHEADADLVRGDPDAWRDLQDLQKELFEAWGMPDPERAELLEHMSSADEMYSGDTLPVEPFSGGETYDIGETTFEVMHSPGHTEGLTSFVMTDRDEVLSGDALLPVYTPNVGGADVRVDRPLAKYVTTLRRYVERDFERAWPGHRDPIDDPTDRAEYIIHHHGERALRVVRVLEERGSADAWTVSADLFGDLENIHVLHGPGEASAHLDHLVEVGDVAREDGQYSLSAQGEARLEDHEGDTWPLRTEATAVDG